MTIQYVRVSVARCPLVEGPALRVERHESGRGGRRAISVDAELAEMEWPGAPSRDLIAALEAAIRVVSDCSRRAGDGVREAHVKSIFDVEDGDELATFGVPGTPFAVRFEMHAWCVLRDGLRDEELTRRAAAEFDGRVLHCQTVRAIGRWLRRQWGIEKIRVDLDKPIDPEGVVPVKWPPGE